MKKAVDVVIRRFITEYRGIECAVIRLDDAKNIVLNEVIVVLVGDNQRRDIVRNRIADV